MATRTRCFLPILLIFLGFTACRPGADPVPEATGETDDGPEVHARFTLMSPEETGVTFANDLREDYHYNNFNFEYMYNGGGVAAGDVNGDGLPDLYFSASLLPNRLYLNLGNFKFQDVTELAGVSAAEGFKTGVAMADINGDGRLDIYACRTSKKDAGLKTDYCFINMGNEEHNGLQVPVFKEMNELLGIADNSNTNHSCFFDYDGDGDLDLLLINHKLGADKANKVRIQQREDGSTVRITTPETPHESNRLYRNDNGRFTDVTESAGLVSSAYSLSATIADFNDDGWPDVFIANDYIEPDFLYINNRDGTFTNRIFEYMRRTSLHSMGTDIADINNDGLPDLAVMEMRPEDPIRYKELVNMMQYDRTSLLQTHGYGRQSGWNTLQLNNGNGTFSEIAHFAGVSSTDWSWSVLLADLDQDGWKDIYITNGYRKDVTQQDYLNYFRDSIARAGGLTADRYPDINEFLKFLPEKKITNYLYINSGNLRFQKATAQAGLERDSYSNGAALADLDLDGDLDLIVNNINDPAFIYRNDITGRHWIQVELRNTGKNIFGIGATADVYAGGMHQHQMLISSRGFFSSSEPILHFGLGDINRVDSIRLTWPDGKAEVLRDIAVDQRFVWERGKGSPTGRRDGDFTAEPLFAASRDLDGWQHQEDGFVDFKRERLLPYMLSAEGPCFAVGDINGDELSDIYAGNGTGFPSALFLQKPDGSFTRTSEDVLKADQHFEDCGAVFADFDADGDQDLIVISGGNALPVNDPGYMVRYYRNDGRGDMSRVPDFPIIRTNAGSVHTVDIDGDGDLDVIIGGRATPGSFPTPPQSYLLRNEGGRFSDVTKEVFPALERLGMITDITSGDMDGDGRPEVVIVGEWMPVSVFSYSESGMRAHPLSKSLEKTAGWWKAVLLEDLDQDGRPELLVGNIGLNHRFTASAEYPLTVVATDVDGNGSIDPFTCFYHRGKLYPYAGRDAAISQVPLLKKKFTRYTPYASATIQEILGDQVFRKADQYVTHTFRTTLFKLGENGWHEVPLPDEVQVHPVMDVIAYDADGDGRKDLLLAGNFRYADSESGEIDAGNGTLLLQQADGSYRYVPNREHGFWAMGEVREMALLTMPEGRAAVLTGNNKGVAEITPFIR